MLARRLLLLLAVLIGLSLLASSIAPVDLRPTPTPTPTPTPSAPRAAPGAASGGSVHASLSAAPRRPARLIRARVGDQVSITVRAAGIDTIALGDLDVEPVEPTVPAHFDLLADERGSYPLILVDAQRRIGTLVVR